ncbi:MAG: hypothetical protein ACKO24_05430 [Leptolyngbyaceae cyanobacterium]
MAVDLVAVPYYGQPASDPNEVRRGKAQQGTTYFHVFATAYVIRKNRRVTLALHYVRKNESLVSVLETLKHYLDQRGIKVKLWLADRAFCSVAALKWFDQQPEAIVPMVARGNQDPPSGSRVLFEMQLSQWTDYTMRSDEEGEIQLRVAVVHAIAATPADRGNGYRLRRWFMPWLARKSTCQLTVAPFIQ